MNPKQHADGWGWTRTCTLLTSSQTPPLRGTATPLWGTATPLLTVCVVFLQAWAVFKGKFKEGDKAEPATWKTRLRCALNKSPDFEEVAERSQLDISEPYKVYRIVPEEEQKSKHLQPHYFIIWQTYLYPRQQTA